MCSVLRSDVAALQGGGQGEGERGEQFFEPGVGDHRGVTLAGGAQRLFGDDVLAQ